MKMRPWLLWTLAVVIAALSLLYQRMTGPTYPVRGRVNVGAESVKYRLPRSHGGEGDAVVKIDILDTAIHGTVESRRFRSDDQWVRQGMERQGNTLIARLPHQPIAGKVEYRIFLDKSGVEPVPLTAESVILRFRGDVPLFVLIPHIVGMVAAMVLSVRAGLEALAGGSKTVAFAVWTTVCLFLGGLLLGALVQKYAFEVYWSGWPMGGDLTDNKTFVAFLFWLVATWRAAVARGSRGWVITAAVFMLVVWLIPHSLLGSELNYSQPGP